VPPSPDGHEFAGALSPPLRARRVFLRQTRRRWRCVDYSVSRHSLVPRSLFHLCLPRALNRACRSLTPVYLTPSFITIATFTAQSQDNKKALRQQRRKSIVGIHIPSAYCLPGAPHPRSKGAEPCAPHTRTAPRPSSIMHCALC
jgi:hypothetical protein